MTEDEEFEALEQRLNMKEQEYEQINHPNGVTTWKTKPKEQPDALRLSSEVFALGYGGTCSLAAAELRRLYEENERLHVENRRLIDRIETMGVPVGVGGYATTTKAQGASNE